MGKFKLGGTLRLDKEVFNGCFVCKPETEAGEPEVVSGADPKGGGTTNPELEFIPRMDLSHVDEL